MIRKLFSLAVLCSTPMFSQVAKDTLWVDQYDYISSKENAHSFKLLKDIKGQETLKSIEVYSAKTKKLESKGTGVLNNEGGAIYLGELDNYDKKGNLLSTFFHNDKNEITKIESIDPRNGNKYTCVYKENTMYQGAVVFQWQNTYLYIELDSGLYTKYEVFNPDNAKNYQDFTFEINNLISKEKYYDENGELKYEAQYQDGQPYQGITTTLNYEKYSLQTVSEYSEGELKTNTTYYSNGKVRSISKPNDSGNLQVYYNQDGKEMGTYKWQILEDDYSMYQEGVNFFFTDYDEINTAYFYENNDIIKSDEYYTEIGQNTIKSSSFYHSNHLLNRIEYYNVDGSLKGQITYKEDGYTPKDGVLMESNSTSLYVDGKLIEKKIWYHNGQVFSETKNNVTTSYTPDGKLLGKVTFTVESPHEIINYRNGTLYELTDNHISSISTYKNGSLVYQANYAVSNNKATLEMEAYYKDNFLIKKTDCYANGNKAQVEEYDLSNYEPLQNIFYDKEGKEIGRYNYATGVGTRVEFSYDRNITAIENIGKQGLISRKTFIAKENVSWNTQEPYYLQAEIDYNKEGVFYAENGDIISTVIYQNGLPYEGKAIIRDNYTSTETQYKNGHKVGVEKITNITDENSINYYTDEGSLSKSEYYSNNALKSTHEYKDDQLHGMTVYYNEEGEVSATLEYVNGYPYEGTQIEASSYLSSIKKTYSKGKLTQIQIFETIDYLNPDQLVMKEVYDTNVSFERTIYDHSSGEIIYIYHIENNLLNGPFQYFENGKVKYEATFKNGGLSSGTVAIEDFNYDKYDDYYATEAPTDTSKYTTLSNTKGVYSIRVHNKEDNKEVFRLDAKVKKGESTLNPLANKRVQLPNLYPANEYNTYSYNTDLFESDPEYTLNQAVEAAAEAATEAVAIPYY